MSFFLITLFICFHETSMIQSLNKGINSGKLLGVTQMSSDIANYADDTSPYKCALHYDKLKESDNLQNIWWFMYNNFKANTTK